VLYLIVCGALQPATPTAWCGWPRMTAGRCA
jgi:hypothetical protein